MLERLKRNKRVVKLLQKAFPDDARCERCGLPVTVAGNMHYVDIKGAHADYFVCCEHCWSKMSYVEKVSSTASLYSNWIEETGVAPYDYDLIMGSLQDDVARNLLERKVSTTHEFIRGLVTGPTRPAIKPRLISPSERGKPLELRWRRIHRHQGVFLPAPCSADGG